MSEDPALRYVLNHRRRKVVATRYFLRHACAFAVVAVLCVVLFLKAQGRPVGKDQAFDLIAAAAVAASAGACLAGIRLSVKSLRREAGAPPSTDPKLQAIGRQIRLFNWAQLLIATAGFLFLTLLAVSLGCHRPDWISWMPSRRR
jgi:hypothetical protein